MHFKKDEKQMVFDLIIFTSGRSYGRNSMVSKPEIPVQNSSMVASSSTIASSSTTLNSTMNVVNQPLLLLSNMSNLMTIKLDNSNYIVWKHQFLWF